jgi:hypothetical protein
MPIRRIIQLQICLSLSALSAWSAWSPALFAAEPLCFIAHTCDDAPLEGAPKGPDGKPVVPKVGDPKNTDWRCKAQDGDLGESFVDSSMGGVPDHSADIGDTPRWRASRFLCGRVEYQNKATYPSWKEYRDKAGSWILCGFPFQGLKCTKTPPNL